MFGFVKFNATYNKQIKSDYEISSLSDFKKTLEKILEHPLNWNIYYIWKDKIEYKHFQHSKDFECPIAPSYSNLIEIGAQAALDFNQQFHKKFI